METSTPDTARSLFVRRFGTAGPAIVLLHGLGASGQSWRLVAERLAGEARVVCPDLLGFGRSPRPPAAYSVDDHLAALQAAFDREGLGAAPVVLGGHSTGAVLALAWAAARPQQFRAVCLMSLPAYRSSEEARTCIAALSPMARATVARPRLGELICGVMCAWRPFWRQLMPLLTPGVPADISRDYVLHDWASYSHTLEHVLINYRIAPAAERLAAAGVPVQLLHGDRDAAAPLEAARELAGRCNWPLRVAPGAEHHLPVTRPGACAAMLRDRLS